MNKRHAKILSAVTMAFLVSWNCGGVSFYGGVSYYGDHCIGSAPFRFGYSEYSYFTDSHGSTIWYSPGRTNLPSDTFHRRTRVYLGASSFSVPMRPLPLILVVGIVLLTICGLGDIGWKYLKRK